MQLEQFLNSYGTQLNSLFTQHRVRRAFVFGSVAKETSNKNSDIDLLIEFIEGLDPLTRGELWWSLYEQLKDLTQSKVDLLTTQSLKNPFFIESVNKTKKQIYGD